LSAEAVLMSGSDPAPIELAWFTPAPPVVKPERILRIHGYPDLARVRPAITAAAAVAAERAQHLCDSRVAFRRVAIEAHDGALLQLHGGISLHCAAFAQTLEGCDEAVAFVLTLGPRLDAKVIEMTDQGDLLDALLLETAGWLAIEDATRQFRTMLRDQAVMNGRRITSRMGPGYSYRIDGQDHAWALDEQRRLFELFGGAALPVTLMESCAMLPKMSRSGLIGVGPSENTAGRSTQ